MPGRPGICSRGISRQRGSRRPGRRWTRIASADHWPAATDRCDVHQLRREDAFVPGEGAWLERLINRLPQASQAQDADEYFAMLDRAQLDRYLSLSEQDSLVELATELQLGPDDVRSLNEDYLNALAEEAFADGVLTAEECDDLLHVARMLGLDDAMVAKILTQGIGHRPRRACHHRKVRLRPGDLVALTGDMELPRADWVECVHRAGLRVGELTRKTKVLVAADPDSQSGKARKARAYGIPVITEGAFAPMVAQSYRDCRHGDLPDVEPGAATPRSV